MGSLLNTLENDEYEKESTCQTIKDIFAMSTKTLDQAGRTGALFHLVRRKAAAQDSGLVNLADMRAKCQYLPLSGDGVFGKNLETCLEKRKEQKEQLNDLLPEFNRKRKFENESCDSRTAVASKVPRYLNLEQGNNTKGNRGFQNSNMRKPQTQKEMNKTPGNAAKNDGNKKDFKKPRSSTQTSWGSFRIPKKNDS